MKFILDTHTHSIASGHAYSTIREMVHSAREKGLELLCITEHGPKMPGSVTDFYFSNLKAVDRYIYGVELLLGAELNILDYDGNVDLSEKVLKNLDIVIASLHTPCISPGTKEENTRAYLNVMKNPYVNIIGHPDDSNYLVDYEALVLGAKEHKKLLELNNSSLNPNNYRRDCRANDITMLELCEKYDVPIVVGSDAHTDTAVGGHDLALELLKYINFPEELVINRSVEELKNILI